MTLRDVTPSPDERSPGPLDPVAGPFPHYAPFLRPVMTAQPGGRAIDLDCADLDWLSLLSRLGMGVTGTAHDDPSAQAAREAGLDVPTAKALPYLRQQPDGCAPLISAFHLARHLPFRDMVDVLQEAHRCLIPGGLLILETRGPDSSVGSTPGAPADAPKARPIPPVLLAHAVEEAGFDPVQIARLRARLRDRAGSAAQGTGGPAYAFGGIGPTYAIIAQKAGNKDLSMRLRGAFDEAPGIGLSALAKGCDDILAGPVSNPAGQADQDLARLVADVRNLGESVHGLTQGLTVLRTEIGQLTARPAWGGLLRSKPAGGPQDKVTDTEMTQDASIDDSRPSWLARLTASWFSEDTRQIYRQLVGLTKGAAQAETDLWDGDLSPRAAYVNGRLLAAPSAREDK